MSLHATECCLVGCTLKGHAKQHTNWHFKVLSCWSHFEVTLLSNILECSLFGCTLKQHCEATFWNVVSSKQHFGILSPWSKCHLLGCTSKQHCEATFWNVISLVPLWSNNVKGYFEMLSPWSHFKATLSVRSNISSPFSQQHLYLVWFLHADMLCRVGHSISFLSV